MPSPPLIVANAVQVRLLGTAAGAGTINVLAAQKSAGVVISQTTANTVGAAIKSAWTARFGTLMTSGAQLVRVGLRDLGIANGTEFLDSGAAVGGSATGDAMPAQISACVTLRTAKAGKSFRGRSYFSGWSETENVAGGLMSAASGTAITSFIADVQSALTASSMTLAVLSKPAYAYVITKTWTLGDGTTQVDTIGRGAARPGAVNNVTIVQNRNQTWETQRRRNNGRGPVPTALVEGSMLEIQPLEVTTSP